MTKNNLLDNRHPEYAESSSFWEFLYQSYRGGKAFSEGKHLHRFPKETDLNYKERTARADRVNFTRQIVDLFTQYVNKESVKRDYDSVPDYINTFWNDTDLKGTSVESFIRDLSVKLALYGTYYAFIDKPAIQVSSKAEEQILGVRPYVYTISPLDVLDYVTDSVTGVITQVLIRERTRGSVDLTQTRESNGYSERFRLWLKAEAGVIWQLYQKSDKGEVQFLDDGFVNIPRIPILKLERTGGSLVDDVADLDKKVWNYTSLLDQIVYDQTFSTLTVPWSDEVDNFYKKWEVTLGTKSILPYPPESSPPSFISPDASQGLLLLEAIDRRIAQIYQLKNLQDTVGNSQKNQPNRAVSGVAKGYDFEKLNAGLALFADDLEKAEFEILKLVSMWQGITDTLDGGIVDYPETFDIKTLVQEATEYQLLSSSVNSDTYRKALQKALVQKASPKLDPLIMTEVIGEIDANSDDL